MKQKIIKIILYILGLACIIYPLTSKFIAFKEQSQVVQEFQEEVEQTDIEDTLKKTELYNEENATSVKEINPNEVESDEVSDVNQVVEYGQMIGYIKIPKINLELPIYEGSTSENLYKGITHMSNSSLPNGGTSTHAILAGHTGVPGVEFFDNLNELEIGDEFYVTYFNITTKYRVIEEDVVLPSETESLKVQTGRTLVTLVTCTPKTINTHRMLVTGELVEEDEEAVEEEENTLAEETTGVEEVVEDAKTNLELLKLFVNKNLKMIYIVSILLAIFIAFIIIDFIVKRKKR